nr:phage tail assembly chaperone [Pseudomonas putida]
MTDINPEGRFHPGLDWRSCSEAVKTGWLCQGDDFVERVESLEERIAIERQWRDTELTARQWLRDRHRDEQDLERPTTLSDEQFIEFLTYLQALRDWPAAGTFPDSALRPTAPAWMAEQIQ